jgi:hypothetical protein
MGDALMLSICSSSESSSIVGNGYEHPGVNRSDQIQTVPCLSVAFVTPKTYIPRAPLPAFSRAARSNGVRVAGATESSVFTTLASFV